MIRIELDTVRKNRSATEYRYINRATCGDAVSQGDGDNIRSCCQIMADSGASGLVEVWRGQTLVFAAIPLDVWASGKALSGEQPEHLRK